MAKAPTTTTKSKLTLVMYARLLGLSWRLCIRYLCLGWHHMQERFLFNLASSMYSEKDVVERKHVLRQVRFCRREHINARLGTSQYLLPTSSLSESSALFLSSVSKSLYSRWKQTCQFHLVFTFSLVSLGRKGSLGHTLTDYGTYILSMTTKYYIAKMSREGYRECLAF